MPKTKKQLESELADTIAENTALRGLLAAVKAAVTVPLPADASDIPKVDMLAWRRCVNVETWLRGEDDADADQLTWVAQGIRDYMAPVGYVPKDAPRGEADGSQS